MATKTWAGQRHTVTWSAGSRGWGARGPRNETRGSHHIISHPISRQIVVFNYISKTLQLPHGIPVPRAKASLYL